MRDLKLENILFLDIETVPSVDSFDGLLRMLPRRPAGR